MWQLHSGHLPDIITIHTLCRAYQCMLGTATTTSPQEGGSKGGGGCRPCGLIPFHTPQRCHLCTRVDRCHGPGICLAQRSFQLNGDQVWARQYLWLSDSVGCQPRAALAPYECNQRYLWYGLAYISFICYEYLSYCMQQTYCGCWYVMTSTVLITTHFHFCV